MTVDSRNGKLNLKQILPDFVILSGSLLIVRYIKASIRLPLFITHVSKHCETCPPRVDLVQPLYCVIATLELSISVESRACQQ